MLVIAFSKLSKNVTNFSQYNNHRKCAYSISQTDDKFVKINAKMLVIPFLELSKNVTNISQ